MTVIYRSPYNVDIPTTDIVSFVFSAGTENSRKKPQYYDAKDPDQCFSLYDAERYVRQIACGLQRLGLKRNDKVLLYCNNRLFFPVLFWGVVAAGCVFTATSPTASVSGSYQLPSRVVHVTKNSYANIGVQNWNIILKTRGQNLFLLHRTKLQYVSRLPLGVVFLRTRFMPSAIPRRICH